MFSKISLGKAIIQLKRIADALEIIALHHAKLDGRMVAFGQKGLAKAQGEPELFHTTDEEMLVNQMIAEDRFRSTGKYAQED